MELKQEIIERLRKKITKPRFKSTIESARLAMDEYEKEIKSILREFIKETKGMLELKEEEAREQTQRDGKAKYKTHADVFRFKGALEVLQELKKQLKIKFDVNVGEGVA